MFLKIKKLFIYMLLFSCILTFSTPVLAQYGLEETAESAGIPEGLREATPESLIGNIINIALSLIGIIFLLLMLYGGLLWMTARGNAQQVDKAKELIIAAVIGVVIVALAYGITSFVINALTNSEAVSSVSTE